MNVASGDMASIFFGGFNKLGPRHDPYFHSAEGTPRFKNDVDPGKYRAKLTPDNGETIVLDSAETPPQ